MTELVSHDRLLELLNYDPATGEFTWKKPQPYSHMMAGDRAGSKHRTGYSVIRIGPRGYLAHRLAWFYVHAAWPTDGIDHKNGNPLDNRIDNLRQSTHSQNMANRKRNVSNSAGFKGVSPNQGKFAAEIKVRGKRIWLGRFDTAEEAHQAYLAAAIRGFGEFARAA